MSVLISAEQSPPTHFLRITLSDGMDRKATKAAWQRLKRRLAYRGVEYCHVVEFHGKEHHHLLLRSSCPDSLQVGKLLQASFGGMLASWCFQAVRSVPATVKYLFKSVKPTSKHACKKALTPPDWKGRQVSFSRCFLVKPIAHLWREWIARTFPKSPCREPPCSESSRG